MWFRSLSLLALVLATAGCAANGRALPSGPSTAGTLLLIGGGLDNDNRHVYERFLALASASGPAHIVIMTAATGPEEAEATDKSEALRTWAPEVTIEVVRRETSTADTVAAVQRATALFFTGGDQKRITARYRPDDRDTPEWSAMQSLLARGGVIAGASAGLAMMGMTMFFTGRSAPALGIAPSDPAQPAREPAVLGPQLGPGMRFLPWAITDSHFFERDRVGRLVAGLEASQCRLGLGIGEDACVEVDLASGLLTGVSVSESLLVDAVHLRRAGIARTGLVARLIAQGDQVHWRDWGHRRAPPPPPPVGNDIDLPIVEPGQNRQLASWRLFRQAAFGKRRLRLDGFAVTAYPVGGGDVAFELLPLDSQ